jgi:hypothetical protein
MHCEVLHGVWVWRRAAACVESHLRLTCSRVRPPPLCSAAPQRTGVNFVPVRAAASQVRSSAASSPQQPAVPQPAAQAEPQRGPLLHPKGRRAMTAASGFARRSAFPSQPSRPCSRRPPYTITGGAHQPGTHTKARFAHTTASCAHPNPSHAPPPGGAQPHSPPQPRRARRAAALAAAAGAHLRAGRGAGRQVSGRQREGLAFLLRCPATPRTWCSTARAEGAWKGFSAALPWRSGSSKSRAFFLSFFLLFLSFFLSFFQLRAPRCASAGRAEAGGGPRAARSTALPPQRSAAGSARPLPAAALLLLLRTLSAASLPAPRPARSPDIAARLLMALSDLLPTASHQVRFVEHVV